MAGRHRRTPAWRRLLLRLRRSDRAGRTAALYAEVVALRATVSAMKAELATAWESAAAAGVSARTAAAARVGRDLPLVQAALAPAELAQTADVAARVPALVGVATIELDLRPDPARTEIALADLPESALLDPKKARDAEVIDVTGPAVAAATDPRQQERRTA